MATLVAAGKVDIPRKLAVLLPPTVRMFGEQFPFSKWFGIGLAIFLLYGPVVGAHGDHNGFRYLLAPLVCPWFAAVYYRLAPLNVYHGYAARISGLLNFDERNDDAQRFVTLFQSAETRSFAWRAARSVALFEVIIMAVLTLANAAAGTLTWALSSSWL